MRVSSPPWEITVLVSAAFRPLWATELDLLSTKDKGWDSTEGRGTLTPKRRFSLAG